MIFKHVYWYMQQISGERLQDHWSSGLGYADKFRIIIMGWPKGYAIGPDSEKPAMDSK